jgi:hypothetical protein
MITIQGNGTIWTLRHQPRKTRGFFVLWLSKWHHIWKNNLMFNNEPELFSIGTINLPLEILEIVVVNTYNLKEL